MEWFVSVITVLLLWVNFVNCTSCNAGVAGNSKLGRVTYDSGACQVGKLSKVLTRLWFHFFCTRSCVPLCLYKDVVFNMDSKMQRKASMMIWCWLSLHTKPLIFSKLTNFLVWILRCVQFINFFFQNWNPSTQIQNWQYFLQIFLPVWISWHENWQVPSLHTLPDHDRVKVT